MVSRISETLLLDNPYNPDARGNADLRDPNHADIAFLNQDNQLNCQLLKVSHHGSKNGTSYEYIVKMSPSHFAISCDCDPEYPVSWRYKFPHPISRLIIGEETKSFNASSSQIPDLDSLSSKTGSTAELGTIIYSINRGGAVKRIALADGKHERVSVADFENHL